MADESPVETGLERIAAALARSEGAATPAVPSALETAAPLDLQASPAVRDALGASAAAVSALRTTCRALTGRERALRAESTEESLQLLAQEKAALERRLGGESDRHIRRSLKGAVAAIGDQERQRDLLRRSADRLDAEVTSLSWTLDVLAAHLVRLRNAGVEASQVPDAAIAGSARQLRDQVEAIADALEQVAGGERTRLACVAVPPEAEAEDAESDQRPGGRERSK